MGWVDYWCNAFTPDRSPLWDASLAEQGTPLVLRSDPLDSFAVPEVMAKRIPNATHVCIPGAGHIANLEQTEAFDAALLNFLAPFAP